MKTISTFDGFNDQRQPRVVRVRYHAGLDGYVCGVTGGSKRRGSLDYFTSDKDDALATAAVMARP